MTAIALFSWLLPVNCRVGHESSGLNESFPSAEGFESWNLEWPQTGNILMQNTKLPDMSHLPGTRLKCKRGFLEFSLVSWFCICFQWSFINVERPKYSWNVRVWNWNKILSRHDQTFLAGIWKRISFIASGLCLHSTIFFPAPGARGEDLHPRGHHIYKTLAGFSVLSACSSCSSLVTTWPSPLLALSFIQAPCTQPAAWASSSQSTTHCMTGKTKQGWLMLLHPQILISRWFVLLSSLVCRVGRGSQKLFLCLEPNKELSGPAECVLWSAGTSGGQSISWFHGADWNMIAQQARGSSPLRLPSAWAS